MSLVCRLCKEDTPTRMVIKKQPPEKVPVSASNHHKYGLIKEIICKNVIKKRRKQRKGFSWMVEWYRDICDNHVLKVRGKRHG